MPSNWGQKSAWSLNEFSLVDRTALITGAGPGIGAAIAAGLAAAGASVVAADFQPDGLDVVYDWIMKRDGRALKVVMDVGRIGEVRRGFELAVDKMGCLDILVNSAGVILPKPALDLEEEEWDQVIGTNLKGLFFCCQAAGRHMIAHGHGGSIVNVASTLGLVGRANQVAYAASKGGVIQVTRSLAIEWATRGIRVNAVAPGPVTTPMTAEIRRSAESEERTAGWTALGRFAQPDEIVGAAVFLASNAASYVTGEVLVVDGGLVAQ